MGGIRILILLGGIGVVSGCSPYVYNQEITSFGNGVAAIVSTYQTGEQAIDSSVTQQALASDATARSRLMLLPGCSQMNPSGTPPKLPDCAVVTFGATTAPTPSPVQKNLADAAPAFNALKSYAAALTAVTNAADDTALKTATQGLTTAASGLAGAVAKIDPDAKAAGSLVTPVGSLIGQGISIYLDQRRYAVLKATVPAMDSNVAVLGQTVEAALLDIRAQQLAQLETDLLDKVQPLKLQTVGKLSESDYQSKLAALETQVAAFNLARATDPATTVTAMVNAHHQLSQALQADTGQATAVLTAAESFATAAEQLQTAVATASAATAKAPAAKK
jgi:hypothetical protein